MHAIDQNNYDPMMPRAYGIVEDYEGELNEFASEYLTLCINEGLQPLRYLEANMLNDRGEDVYLEINIEEYFPGVDYEL